MQSHEAHARGYAFQEFRYKCLPPYSYFNASTGLAVAAL